MLETRNMNDLIKTLQIFDLDETFFRMPSYAAKKQVEKEELMFNGPYEFYDHPKSICTDSYNIQLIGPVYEAWKRGSSLTDHATVLITHRVKNLKEEVHSLLKSRGVEFDETYFLGRVSSKTEIAKKLIHDLPKLEIVEIYEDSIEQLGAYQELFKQLDFKLEVRLYIVDKSKMFRLEDFKISEKTRIRLI